MTDTANYYEVLAPRIEKLIEQMALKWEARWNAFKSVDDGMRIQLLNFLKNNPRCPDELLLECWQMYLNDQHPFYTKRKHPMWCFFQSQNFDRYSAQAVHSLRRKSETAQSGYAPNKTVQQQASEVGDRLKAIKALQQMKQQLTEGFSDDRQTASACGSV